MIRYVYRRCIDRLFQKRFINTLRENQDERLFIKYNYNYENNYAYNLKILEGNV